MYSKRFAESEIWRLLRQSLSHMNTSGERERPSAIITKRFPTTVARTPSRRIATRVQCNNGLLLTQPAEQIRVSPLDT